MANQLQTENSSCTTFELLIIWKKFNTKAQILDFQPKRKTEMER